MIKILIIDDEKDIRDTVKLRLKKEYDCWVDVAGGAKEGLELYKKKHHELVFLDYLFLGGNDGINLLFDIKRLNVPVVTVLMTGYMKNIQEVKAKGLGLAPDEFLAKPFPVGALKTIMMKYFPKTKL